MKSIVKIEYINIRIRMANHVSTGCPIPFIKIKHLNASNKIIIRGLANHSRILVHVNRAATINFHRRRRP